MSVHAVVVSCSEWCCCYASCSARASVISYYTFLFFNYLLHVLPLLLTAPACAYCTCFVIAVVATCSVMLLTRALHMLCVFLYSVFVGMHWNNIPCMECMWCHVVWGDGWTARENSYCIICPTRSKYYSNQAVKQQQQQ